MTTPHSKENTVNQFIRLDFKWNDRFERSSREVTNGLNSSNIGMNHVIHSADVNTSDGAQVGVITSMEQVLSSEVTAFGDAIRQAAMFGSNPQTGDIFEDPGEPSSIHASSVVLGPSSEENTSMVSATHPAIHYAIHDSTAPSKVTAQDLESFARDTFDTKLDVQIAGSGFNVMIREATVTTDDAHAIKKHIIEHENIPHASVKTLYVCPQSSELPEPFPSQ